MFFKKNITILIVVHCLKEIINVDAKKYRTTWTSSAYTCVIQDVIAFLDFIAQIIFLYISFISPRVLPHILILLIVCVVCVCVCVSLSPPSSRDFVNCVCIWCRYLRPVVEILSLLSAM